MAANRSPLSCGQQIPSELTRVSCPARFNGAKQPVGADQDQAEHGEGSCQHAHVKRHPLKAELRYVEEGIGIKPVSAPWNREYAA